MASGLAVPALVSCEEEPTAGEQVEVAVEALCRWHFECACDNATTDTYATREDCQAELGEAILEEVRNKGQIELDSGCLAELAQGFDDLGCAVEAEVSGSSPLGAAQGLIHRCGMFRGEGADGDACTPLTGGLGDDCGPDLYCSSVSSTCVLVGSASEGKACETDDECASGLFCFDVPEESEEGAEEPPEPDDTTVCAALPSAGEPCAAGRSLCAAEATCSTTDLCVALPTAGMSCATNPSAGGLVCAPGNACNNGVCEAGSVEGAGCGLSCALGSACEGGFCRAAPAAGCAFEL